MFRLRNWEYPTESGGKPGVVDKYTMDIVYSRLAPRLVEELKNPKKKKDLGRPNVINGYLPAHRQRCNAVCRKHG
ncbi:hypothetical protein CAP48_12375 [Advenella sp. S44]|uniref:P63C domain-containing protein n=1 Tax=Advenella sp. S44 TaxID=1982755 RepID=UPI000C29D062|nr:hypothetical protein CAP48_12375 [Advenella sp. S44]